MNLKDIIREEYDDDATKYYDELSMRACDMLRNLHSSVDYRDVCFIRNKYEEFIDYLMDYYDTVSEGDDIISDLIRELTNKLVCREHELEQVKHERNVLMDELTRRQSTYQFNKTAHEETTRDRTTTYDKTTHDTTDTRGF